LTDETRGLIGEREFKLMKPTVILINTTRGDVVDREALLHVLREKWILAGSFDAPPGEPLDPDDFLLSMDNVIVSPHSGGGFDRLQFDSMHSALTGVLEVMQGQLPRIESVMNPEVLD
jgi:phosphoglycerate dehydrogenase-like enzyme